GHLGEICFVRITQMMKPEEADFNSGNLPWKVRFEETGGGKFIDMGTHLLDLVEYLISPIDSGSIASFAANFAHLYKAEDAVCASMRCKNGVLISGNWIYSASYNEDELLIAGSKGKISTGGLSYNPVKVLIDGKEEIKEFVEPQHIAMPYQQLIINEILGLGKSPADIMSAVNNVLAIDKILRQYRDKIKN
ncbi:MAG: gfo/Idh/MocA family oxidoreductase, partial [Elusimicrobiota bacterium]|nr:gfo/Idh/MocA family oxidoreductase [Elusimicrobiota bacterium]